LVEESVTRASLASFTRLYELAAFSGYEPNYSIGCQLSEHERAAIR
jgi:hypothetical protein